MDSVTLPSTQRDLEASSQLNVHTRCYLLDLLHRVCDGEGPIRLGMAKGRREALDSPVQDPCTLVILHCKD